MTGIFGFSTINWVSLRVNRSSERSVCDS